MKKATYESDSLVVKVGKRIRALRMAQRLSLRDFGKLAGVHPFHVMAAELGQVAINTKTLGAIAKALGVTPADLLNVDVEADLGFVLELMRTRPEVVAEVGKRARGLVVN